MSDIVKGAIDFEEFRALVIQIRAGSAAVDYAAEVKDLMRRLELFQKMRDGGGTSGTTPTGIIKMDPMPYIPRDRGVIPYMPDTSYEKAPTKPIKGNPQVNPDLGT